MKRLSYEEQLKMLCERLQAEIDELRSLPTDEAKALAHKRLVEVGIINEDGSLFEPYVRMQERYRLGLGYAQTDEERARCRAAVGSDAPLASLRQCLGRWMKTSSSKGTSHTSPWKRPMCPDYWLRNNQLTKGLKNSSKWMR